MAAEACARCGTTTVPDASYCHRCGLRLDVVVTDLDVFAPPGSSPQGYSDEPGSGERLKTAVGVFAVLAVVALAVVYVGSVDGQKDADDALPGDVDEGPADISDEVEPESEEEDSTDGDALVARTVNPMTQVSHAELGQGLPVGVLRHNGEAMVFMAPMTSHVVSTVGLDLWVGPQFDQLTKVPLVIPEGVQVSDVAVVDGALLAVGSDEEGQLIAWRSADGRSWTPESIPEPEYDDAWSSMPQQILVGEAGVGVMVDQVGRDGYEAYLLSVLEHFGLGQEDLGSLHLGDDGTSTALVGPFGFVFGRADTDEFEFVQPWFEAEPPSMGWLFNDGDGWIWQYLDTPYVQSAGVDENGGFFRVQWEDGRSNLQRSTDGRTWTSSPLSGEFESLVPWGNGLLTVSPTADLSFGHDGEVDRLGMPALAPSTSEGGALSGLQLGADGVVVQWHDWGFGNPLAQPSATLLKDGYALSTEDGWSLELWREGELVWSSNGSPRPETFATDLDTRTVLLLDDQTGEPIVEFTIADLQALAEQVHPSPSTLSARILFSRNLEDWHQGLPGTFEDPVSLRWRGVEFIDDQIAVFGYRDSVNRGPTVPATELWMFRVPSEGE